MDKAMSYTIRPLKPDETPLLRDFLYEAIFIPDGMEAPPRDVIDLPELKIYIEDFGTKRDDYCWVADYNGKVIGAVWTRIMHDYGHVDDTTPSLSISLYKEYRNQGIGRRLMETIIENLKEKGYRQISLSVQKANYAVDMYLKLGFTNTKETIDEYIMVKKIEEPKPKYKMRSLEERDIPEMQNLFRSTVLNINIRDYTQEEAEDWASCIDSAKLKNLLSQHRFIGAFDDNDRMIGYSSMNEEGYLHSLFVHKDWQGKGVATQLLHRVEHIAMQFRVTEITTEASLTARPFFEKKGYTVIKTQRQKANRLRLTNFLMHKPMKE